MNFVFTIPTKIIFGTGTLDNIGSEVNQFGQNIAIICGQSATKNNMLNKIKTSLGRSKINKITTEIVSSDPTDKDVEKIIKNINQHDIDVIIALGGGSVIDAAKAASVLYKYNNVSTYIGRTLSDDHPHIPVIAAPTTGGTGSEVTKGAIITDTTKNFKSGIRGNSLFPKAAIVDPDVLLSIPKHVMEETLFDAFTHLFETYLVKKSHGITEAISITGLEKIAYLINLDVINLNDENNRVNLMLASLMGGINIGMVGSCLPHRLQQSMGAVSEIKCSHGRGLSSVYRAWIKQVYPYAKVKIDRISNLFKVERPLDMIKKIQNKLNMPTCLADSLFQAHHINLFCSSISGDLSNDPMKNIDKPLIKKIFTAALNNHE